MPGPKSLLALCSVALAAGCHGGGSPPAPAGCDASVPARLACDRPAVIDPSAVVDLATFREQASAAVCDWSLRCSWYIGDSFCHPRFAEREAGPGPRALPFDAEVGRTCIEQLMATSACADALVVAEGCLAVSEGRSAFSRVGDPCSQICGGLSPFCDCGLGLVCLDGQCGPAGGQGDACSGALPCQPSLVCTEGVCDFEVYCSSLACGALPECHGDPSECVPVCDGGVREHHVGCACDDGSGCPLDVSECTHSVCTLRPFVGDACVADGASCFGSTCVGNRCVPTGRARDRVARTRTARQASCAATRSSTARVFAARPSPRACLAAPTYRAAARSTSGACAAPGQGGSRASGPARDVQAGSHRHDPLPRRRPLRIRQPLTEPPAVSLHLVAAVDPVLRAVIGGRRLVQDRRAD